jgi:hypothetical protein
MNILLLSLLINILLLLISTCLINIILKKTLAFRLMLTPPITSSRIASRLETFIRGSRSARKKTVINGKGVLPQTQSRSRKTRAV